LRVVAPVTGPDEVEGGGIEPAPVDRREARLVGRRERGVAEGEPRGLRGELRARTWAPVAVERPQAEVLVRERRHRLVEAELEHAVERQRVELHRPVVVGIVDPDAPRLARGAQLGQTHTTQDLAVAREAQLGLGTGRRRQRSERPR